MKNFRWDKKYLYWGITAFLVIAASLLFFMFINNLAWLKIALAKFFNILSPFVWGLVIAYLICPLMLIYQKNLFTPLGKLIYKKREQSGEKDEKIFKFARGWAVLLSIISLLVLIAAFVLMVAPQVYLSIESIIANSADYANQVVNWIDKMLSDYPQVEQAISSVFGNVSNGVFDWLKSTLMPKLSGIISNVTSGVYIIVKGVYNVLIGIIVSVYVLFNKETFGAHAKKIIYCIFSVDFSNRIIKAVNFVDSVFIGFLSGKILDSTIIGIICYVCCALMKMPYALLVAVIVGITNIIPFFGPFIGAIPSALIIFMVSPFKCLIFIIFIILLQQLDGNFIGPKILGNSVGINGFWIMFSIILGTGLFGFKGMLLGVPVFVIIYTAIRVLIEKKLKRSGLPTLTAVYKTMEGIDPVSGEVITVGNKRRRSSKKNAYNKKAASPAKTEKAEENKNDETD